MGTPFDGIQDALFETVKSVYGTDASWAPSTGGPALTAKVLFKEPTNEKELAGREYNPIQWIMEYKQGDFDNLFELVRSGTSEMVTIDNQNYYVRTVTALYDGKTLKSLLEKI